MLDVLPDELFERIVSFLPNAQPISRLSQTSRNHHRQVQDHGWRAFARKRFPTFDVAVPSDWADVSRSFTTLLRDWDRRAFRARYLEPSLHYNNAADGGRLTRWRRPHGQTMGFRPAMDSHASHVEGRLRDCEHILVSSAGSELLLRRRGATRHSDGEWWSYRPPGSKEGRNDITTVNIVKSEPIKDQKRERVIAGTASGDLSCLELPRDSGDHLTVVARFETRTDKAVQSASLLEADDRSLLATHLSDNHITLFPVQLEDMKEPSMIKSADRLNITPDTSRACYVWSTEFISPTHLAVGVGPTSQPIKVYELTPSGISQQPLRSFSLGHSADDVVISSVFAFEPLAGRQLGGTKPGGHVFFSASMHGVRLHDMRSPRNVEQMYEDTTDDSGIYSLLSRGANRLIAGASREAQLKVFDLRMPHPAEYSYLSNGSHGGDACSALSPQGESWKVYLNPLDTSPFHRQHNGSRNWVYRSTRGSVYSLSSPSPWSPLIFAGVEHAVVELEFGSILESQRRGPKPRMQERFGEIDLPMYSMTKSVQSWEQMSVRDTCKSKERRAELDERWKRT